MADRADDVEEVLRFLLGQPEGKWAVAPAAFRPDGFALALARAGMIEMVEDRRQWAVRLTEAGRRTLRAMLQIAVATQDG
jgi:hypothetical protein